MLQLLVVVQVKAIISRVKHGVDYSNISQSRIQPNFCFNSDKYLANCCVIFDGSEVISVFNFVVGTCALSG